MPYRVEYAPAAEKQIESLPRPVQARIFAAADSLAENPRPHGGNKLAGSEDEYRIVVGRYRIIYAIEDKRLIVLVLKVGHRKDVYRGR